jgi:hypothetical protein
MNGKWSRDERTSTKVFAGIDHIGVDRKKQLAYLLRVPYSTTVLSKLAKASEPRPGCRSWRRAWPRRCLSEGAIPSPRSFKASVAGVAASQFLDASLHNSLPNRIAATTTNHQGIA